MGDNRKLDSYGRPRRYDYRARPMNWQDQPWVHVRAIDEDAAITAALLRMPMEDFRIQWVVEGWDVEIIEPDKCAYCGRQYHPMPIYTNESGGKIWVCHLEFGVNETGESYVMEVYECDGLAVKEGYTYNPVITPRR